MPPAEPAGLGATLALAYAPAAARPALAALFALDEHLAALATAPREATLTAIRLAWWREALAGLGPGGPPADPLLRACRDAGLDPAALAAIGEGWEAAVDGEGDGDHARLRGGGLFALAASRLGGADASVTDAGAGWALADLAARSAPPRAAALADIASPHFAAAFAVRWPRRLRPLGAMALLARDTLLRPGTSQRRRLARLMAFAVTGR